MEHHEYVADIDMFRDMYESVSAIVDECGVNEITMKILRSRLEDVYDCELPAEATAMLEDMIRRKFEEPDTQSLLAALTASEGSSQVGDTTEPLEASGPTLATTIPVAETTHPVATKVPVPPNPNLERLGVVDREKTFPSTEGAKDWIKQNLFLGARGKGKDSPYVRYVCSSCPFVVRVHSGEGDEKHVNFLEENSWHSAECPRPAKGVHGLSTGLRAAAKETAPRTLLENECKRVLAGTAPTAVAGTAPTAARLQVPLTRRQAQNVRNYEANKARSNFDECPSTFLQAKFPGCIVSSGNFGNARVVCGMRPWLLSELIKQDQICVDATYWVAPKDGNVVTIGFTKYDSFVPTFFAVFEPLEKGEKCTESSASYAYVFSQFELFVRALAADIPAAATWAPRVAVRDMACEIKNGIQAVFANCADFVCWFHVKQALDRWFDDKKVCDELRTLMSRLMDTLHFSHDMSTFLEGLRVAQAELRSPMWMEFWAWNRAAHRMPGGANERWSLAHAIPNDTTTNCGIERWHGHMKSRVRSRGVNINGHLALRDCSEFILGELLNTESLMKVSSTKGYLNLPCYFERREATRAEDVSSMTQRSTEYQHVLQMHASTGQVVFQWTRVVVAGAPATSKVVLLGDAGTSNFEHRSTSWNAFLRTQAVHTTTSTHCTCISFKTNAFCFCKHVIAVQSFLLVCPPRETPATTPPRDAQREDMRAVVLTPLNPNAAPRRAVSKRGRSKSTVRMGDVTPAPDRSFYNPAKREPNALERAKQ